MISFRIEFDERRFRSELERAVARAAQAAIEERVRGVRCPVHGRAPTLTRSSAVDPSRTVGMCCGELKAAVERAVGDRA